MREQHGNLKELNLCSARSKSNLYINIVVNLLFLIWISSYRLFYSSFLSILSNNQDSQRTMVYVFTYGISIFISVLAMGIFHEFCHVLVVAKYYKHCYIFYGFKKHTVFCDMWLSKSYALLLCIAPFLFFIIISVISYTFTSNLFVSIWIIYINVLLSSHDLVDFFIILFRVPRKASIYANYFWRQQY